MCNSVFGFWVVYDDTASVSNNWLQQSKYELHLDLLLSFLLLFLIIFCAIYC